MPYSIAIIGRPNVGKSTLFNRMTGRRDALVSHLPGLTRDRREAEVRINGASYILYDTAGLEDEGVGEMERLMMAQTRRAMDDGDVLLFIIDGQDGIMPLEEEFAATLHKSGKPVIIAINKCDSKGAQQVMYDAYRLGFENVIGISAAHGMGVGDLEDVIESVARTLGVRDEDDDEIDEHISNIPQIAIVGRPNVGKSTLFNAIIGDERSITSDVAGTTRDSVHTDITFEDAPVRLVDTAGLRKKSKKKDMAEALSVGDSLRAIQYANIAVMMLDATRPFEKQDLTLMDHIMNEGRGMIVALNKWDLVPRRQRKPMLDMLREAMESYHLIRNVPLIGMSAKEGDNIASVLREALRIFEMWNKRITTAKLNCFLEEVVSAHPPPLISGRRLKFQYITQSKARPPRFVLFTSSNIDKVPQSYIRYMSNALCECFGFEGVPLRLMVRKKKNPYD